MVTQLKGARRASMDGDGLEQEIQGVVDRVPSEVLDDIRTVQSNVRAFANRQLESVTDFEVGSIPGVFLGQRHHPIPSVGAYIPGGRYPLVASAHMTVVTAKVAGVPRVAACTPPIHGKVPESTIAANYNVVMRVAHELHGGEVYVNRTLGEAFQAHHSGHKQSGVGGEDGYHGLLRYTGIRSIHHQHGGARNHRSK